MSTDFHLFTNTDTKPEAEILTDTDTRIGCSLINLINISPYSTSYGAPYLIDGQLESPDPGCGANDLGEALTSTYNHGFGPFAGIYDSLLSNDGTRDPRTDLPLESLPQSQLRSWIG